MVRVVFVFVLIAGMVSGVSSACAQNSARDADLNWPTTAIIDDAPVPKAKQKPLQANAAPQGDSSSTAPTAALPEAGQAATGGDRPPRNASTQQGRGDGDTRPRRQAAPSAGDNDGEAGPRRRAAAPASGDTDARPRRQASPESGDSDGDTALGSPLPPVPARREALAPVAREAVPMTLNVAHTAPLVPADDGLGKLIGQMLIVGFQGTAPDESWVRQVAAQIEGGKIGGVLVMGHNMLAPDQLTKLTAAFRRTKAQVAPFIAVEQAGGLTQRLPVEKGFKQYASAAALGLSNDPLNAFNLYQRMAMELAVHGFNVNLGPVVDLQQTGENGTAPARERRYGSQPKHVAAFAKAFRMAHHGEGLLTVLQHFPGPAGPDAPWDAASLEPYRQLVAGGNADMVMVGHLSHPEFSDEPGLPASLSKKAIQTRLREEIGFKGVVISDDLDANAVAERFPLEESVVRAINAGNDLLMVANRNKPSAELPERLTAIIRGAVTSGVLTRAQLQASYDRIIAAKQSISPAAREIASAKQTEGGEEKPAAP